MDAELKLRKQVSYDQLNGLLEFLQEHQDLAKGFLRGRRGKLHSVKLWNLCAKKLNVSQDGATKDGKGWSKFWCDWKYRVRRKALELKAAKDNNLPAPDGIVPLSQMEDCILSLIGGNAVDGVVIKSDPLADGDSEEEADVQASDDVTSLALTASQSGRPTRSRKRRHSSQDPSDGEDGGGPSNHNELKPKIEVIGGDNSDHDDDASSEFLRLENEKLESSRRIQESIQTMTSEITRLADVMSHIRDVLINNRINV